MSPDPILAQYIVGDVNEGATRPSNLALYTYVWNRLVSAVDPNGREVRVVGRPWAANPTIRRDSSVGSGRGRASYFQRWSASASQELDITIYKTTSEIALGQNAQLSNPDKYVPSRTLGDHEMGHLRVADRFYSKDIVDMALEQADVDLSAPATNQELTQRSHFITKYLKDYEKYVNELLLHREAVANGDPNYDKPVLPNFYDPVTKTYHGVSERQAEDLVREVEKGIPGVDRNAR